MGVIGKRRWGPPRTTRSPNQAPRSRSRRHRHRGSSRHRRRGSSDGSRSGVDPPCGPVGAPQDARVERLEIPEIAVNVTGGLDLSGRLTGFPLRGSLPVRSPDAAAQLRTARRSWEDRSLRRRHRWPAKRPWPLPESRTPDRRRRWAMTRPPSRQMEDMSPLGLARFDRQTSFGLELAVQHRPVVVDDGFLHPERLRRLEVGDEEAPGLRITSEKRLQPEISPLLGGVLRAPEAGRTTRASRGSRPSAARAPLAPH